MSLLQKAKLKLAKILKIEFATTQTDQGILEHDGDQITVGTDVFIQDEQGELTPAPDGNYENTEESITYIVEEGIVVDIIQENDENKDQKEKETESEDEKDNLEQEEEYVNFEQFNELAEIVKTLTQEVSQLKEQLEGVEQMNKKFKKQNEEFRKILKTSIDIPATQKDKKNFSKSGDSIQERFLKGWE